MGELSRVRGALGEVRAEQAVMARGMTVLARNFSCRGAEIDLIALDGRVVAFIEVKMRTGASRGRAAVTPQKQKRVSLGALVYLSRNGLMDRQARFDVIEIQGDGSVAYIENAFPYQGPAF